MTGIITPVKTTKKIDGKNIVKYVRDDDVIECPTPISLAQNVADFVDTLAKGWHFDGCYLNDDGNIEFKVIKKTTDKDEE